MSKLQGKKILIINDSPIQSKDLKKFLEKEKEAKTFLAEDLNEAMRCIQQNSIEVIFAEFTMPKNFKFKINRYCKLINKEIPKYLVVNTRVIINKKENKNNENVVIISSSKDIDDELLLDHNKLEVLFDISKNEKELYENPLSLEISSLDRKYNAEFLELMNDGIICALSEKLIINQTCEFAIQNFLNRPEPIQLSGIVKEANKDEDEGFYITYIQLDASCKAKWNKILIDLAKKQEQALNFIKAANE